MADPAKTPEEIEDVLASIRRLVSDEPSAHARRAAPAEQQHVSPDRVERLVLTAALRVPDPVETAAPAAHLTEVDENYEPSEAANVFEDADALSDAQDLSDDADHAPENASDETLQSTDDVLQDIEDAPSQMAEATAEDDPVTDPDAGATDAAESALLAALALDTASDLALDSSNAEDNHSDWQPDDRLAEYDAVGSLTDDGELEEALSEREGDVADADGETTPQDETHQDDATDESVAEDLVPQADAEADDAAEDAAEADVAEDDVASDADLADLIQLDGAALETAEFESDTGDENWPEDNAEAALLSLVARREPAAPEAHDPVDGDTPEQDAEQEPDVAQDLSEELDTSDEPASERIDSLARAVQFVASADNAAVTPDTAEHDAPREEAEAVAEADSAQADVPFTPVFSRRNRAALDAKSMEEDAADGPTASPDDLSDETSLWAPPDNLDDILDEEALREIIVGVVREELQGVLGQRITRNVRKMVRREIRLALAAEDLE